MPIIYYAAYDDSDTPIGLFRVVQDDDAQTLDLERLTAEGTWENDPSLIDDLHEPEVRLVSAADADTAKQAILAATEPDAGTLDKQGPQIAADASAN